MANFNIYDEKGVKQGTGASPIAVSKLTADTTYKGWTVKAVGDDGQESEALAITDFKTQAAQQADEEGGK